MTSIPFIYWKVHEQLKRDGLDDETLAAKFRLTKKDAKKVRKDIEFWFGSKPKKSEVLKSKVK